MMLLREKMNFCIKLGGVSVEICHRYEYIKRLCRDYITEQAPAFSAMVTDDQIEAEMRLTDNRFSNEICESTCLHREIVKGLVKYGVILMHSAVIAVDGIAYVFMAKSGVGKSTHIRLWQKLFGERAVIVNGDKPMFSFAGDTLMVHGSPWKGKEGLGSVMTVPVGGICLLERGEKNRIAPAKEAEVVDKIFHQVLLPTNTEELMLFMELMNRILKAVPFYRLQCNMETEAALVAYEGMRKEQI